MAAQQGFVYERNVAKYLKPLGFVLKNFVPAGAGHDQPDLMLLYKKGEEGCELKITAASAGSLVVKYTPGAKEPWGFDESPDVLAKEERESPEKIFIRGLAKEVKVFAEVARRWHKGLGAPYKVEKKYQDTKWQSTAGKLSLRQRYERDHKTFKELKGVIDASKISQYYNQKETYYINVGTHGFYLMGPKNPYGLKEIPRFGKAARATWRLRVQSKGGGNYQFTFSMDFSITAGNKSPYNIGPTRSKTDVTVDKNNVKLPFYS